MLAITTHSALIAPLCHPLRERRRRGRWEWAEFGPRASPDHVVENVAAGALRLSHDDLARLESIPKQASTSGTAPHLRSVAQLHAGNVVLGDGGGAVGVSQRRGVWVPGVYGTGLAVRVEG